MGVKIGPKNRNNYNRQYGGLLKKKTKVDPRSISIFSTENLKTRLGGGRKKDHLKIIRELAKRTSSDKKEQKAFISLIQDKKEVTTDDIHENLSAITEG